MRFPQADNFLSKLLTLEMTKIPENSRKKGRPDLYVQALTCAWFGSLA